MKKMIFVLITAVLVIASNAFALDMNQVKIHGFISQGYLQTDKNDFYFAETEDGTFQFNEMGINFASELTDNLRVGIQFLSRDLGELGNNKVEIDWAFADYRYRNWLGLRAGKIKRPYGLYNRIRDVDAARTGIFLPILIYDDVDRDMTTSTTGIGIYGYLPYGFSYELQYGTIQTDENGGPATNTEWLMNTKVSNVEAGDSFTAYLEWETPLKGLKLAGTAFQYPDISLESSMGKLDLAGMIYVASAEYVYDRFTFAAEYISFLLEITLNDTSKIIDPTLEGWYVSGSYQFTDWFTLGSYYGEIYSDKGDRDGNRYKARGLPASLGWRKDLAMTMRFDINEYWIFKLECHRMNGLAQVQTPPNEADDNWFLFAAKVTFSF